MKPYREMSKEELASLKEQLEAVYKEYQGKNLSLNMARGKPCKEQLDLSLPMMDVLNSSSDYISADGEEGFPGNLEVEMFEQQRFRKLKKIKFLSRYNVYFGQYLL